MKKLLTSSLLALLSHMSILGYSLSHNQDSALPEVTIFVFTSEKDFEKLLENQGITQDTLKTIRDAMPKIISGTSLAVTAAGNPEIVPVIAAIGAGLTAATKYAVGPLSYILQQKYNVAIHKHTKRGNKGKDSTWGWKSIQEQTGVDPEDPYGLFVVFLNPTDKKVLLMTPLQSNAKMGFKAVKDPQSGKLVGQAAPYEIDLKEAAEKDPSILARAYAYVQNRYDNPHKIIWDIKNSIKDVQKKFESFVNKYPTTKDKMAFISGQLDETMQNIKNYDSATGKEDFNNLVGFFKREIEAGKKIADDPEAKRLVNRVIAKFNLLSDAVTETIIKPQTGYTKDVKKLAQEKEKMKEEAEAEVDTFEHVALDKIVPLPDAGLDESEMSR